MRYVAISKCQYDRRIWLPGNILEFSGEPVACPVCKGEKKVNGVPCAKCSGTGRCVPPHHFMPLGSKEVSVEQNGSPVIDADQISAIREEMNEMGAAYDRRWKLDKMKNALIAAKKERGL